MKIGILTHHYINNFGAFLQAYALQQAVKEMCPEDEVYIINYVNKRHFIINIAGWWRFYKNRENFAIWKEKISLPGAFAKIRKKHFSLTKRARSSKEINEMKFDTIIVGSDEVWNYMDPKSVDKTRYGIGLDCKNIISYAPSAGQSFNGGNIPEFVREGLRSFASVSVRDEKTYSLAEALGIQASRVLDPTFLSDFPHEEVEGVKKPYILFYYCDNIPQEALEDIKEFARENNYELYGAGEGNKLYKSTTVNISPFEWINMFKNASYVVTGTFHGAVFSILNKRQFACYATKPSRIEKVNSLLSEFELQDRKFCGSDVIDILTKEIDYEKCYEIINKKVEASKKFLKDSLNNGRQKSQN